MTPRFWPEQLEIQLFPCLIPHPLGTGFNCGLRPVAEVKTEREGRGLALLLALGFRGWVVHTSYSITLYLLALLASVISSLPPVWREDYKCDGLIQDTGGPIISVKPASHLGQPPSPQLSHSPSHSLARRVSSMPGFLGRGGTAERVSGRQMVSQEIRLLQEQMLEASSEPWLVAPKILLPEALPTEAGHGAGMEDRTYRLRPAHIRGGGLCFTCMSFWNLSQFVSPQGLV